MSQNQSNPSERSVKEQEFIRLLTEHQNAIRAYISSMMPGSPSVQDILQETSLLLWEKRDNFVLGTNFIAWAFAVARYRVLDHRRKMRRDQRLVFSDELLDTLALPPEETLSDQLNARRKALTECLSRLSSKNREIIKCRYDADTSIEDYAAETGRSAGALRVALFRIRQSLKSCIQQKVGMELNGGGA